MTDELTPEERDALKSLPRERTPSAGLEDRVVAAMRERGVLAPARPARVIRITTGRVAGLVAACVALMIGAYSIGVQRGAFRPEVRETLEPRTAEPTTMNEVAPLEIPATPPAAPATGVAPEQPREATRAQASRPEPALTREMPAKKTESKQKVTDADADLAQSVVKDDAAKSTAGLESVESAPAPAATVPAREPVATGKVGALSPAPQSLADRATPMMSKANERTYRLDTRRVVVDAPDSVRITELPDERALRIDSPDGVIRIRAAEDRLHSLATDQPAAGEGARRVRLGPSEFLVDAPKDVRIEEDESGRMLLIHTSSGLIRIRLAV